MGAISPLIVNASLMPRLVFSSPEKSATYSNMKQESTSLEFALERSPTRFALGMTGVLRITRFLASLIITYVLRMRCPTTFGLGMTGIYAASFNSNSN